MAEPSISLSRDRALPVVLAGMASLAAQVGCMAAGGARGNQGVATHAPKPSTTVITVVTRSKAVATRSKAVPTSSQATSGRPLEPG